MKIDLASHYGFASLPNSHDSLDEGGDVSSPLMVVKQLNSKIGHEGGEGGPPLAPTATPVPLTSDPVD